MNSLTILTFNNRDFTETNQRNQNYLKIINYLIKEEISKLPEQINRKKVIKIINKF